MKDKFVQSEIEEAKRTSAWLKTKRPQPVKWIARGIPAAWYAISVLAPSNGIRSLYREARQSKKTGRYHAIVQAKKGDGKYARTHIGAATSKDPNLALCYAYRNAIRQLLPMQIDSVDKPVYRTTRDEAIRRFA